MNSKSSHPIIKLYTLLIAVAALIALRSIAHGAQIQQGDQIKLTREEPLLFHDQVFRAGKEGESFSVLAYHPEQKKVFVLAKDKDGKDVALSVAEDAITVVTKASNKLDEQALAAAKSGKLDEAKPLIAQAIKSNPTDGGLQAHNTAIAALATAKNSLDRAKAEHPKNMAAAAAKRKNAAVVDRPNPLNPNDDSNQNRAEKMRDDANKVEAAAKQAVVEAEKAHLDAIAALEGGTSASATPAGKGNAPAPAKWEDDPAIIPTDIILPATDPSYETTLEFINGMIQDYFPYSETRPRLWFGSKSRKMNLGHSTGAVAFNPKSLTPDVKFGKAADDFGRCYVELSCTNGRAEITLSSSDGRTTQQVKSFRLLTADRFDQEKLIKACQHLIEMFGGRKDAF